MAFVTLWPWLPLDQSMVSRVHHLRCMTTVTVLSSKEVYQCLRHSSDNKRRVLGSSSNSVPLLCSNLKLQFRVRRLFSNQRPLNRTRIEDIYSSDICTCAALLLSRNLIKSCPHDYCIGDAPTVVKSGHHRL